MIGMLVGVAQDPTPVEVNAADFTTLQAAFDALHPSGGIVRLAPKRYDITEPLIVRTSDTLIQGAGAATRIVNLNQGGQPALHIRSDEYDRSPDSRLWRIQMNHFRISGNSNSGDGILAEGINEILISELSVDHNGGHGVNLLDCYEDPRVSDSILTYNAQAGLNIARGHDIVVNANQFEENNDGVRCTDSFNLTCNANNFDDHLRHGIVIENTYGSVISGNMIEECQGLAMLLDRDCYGMTLSSNVIAHDFEGGVDLRDAWGCAVSGNTFTIVHHFGVRVGPDSGRITITGNNFSNSYLGGGKHKRILEHDQITQIDVGSGVLLENTEDIVISGNLFAGIDGKAIVCDPECERILITGNIVRDFGRKKAVNFAIDKPSDKVSLVKDNIVH